jgi:thiamine biosynthesis protein ThiS
MVTVEVNGEQQHFSETITVAKLLEHLSINRQETKIAVELNATICPQSAYHTTILKHNDKIEIITAVGGG